MRDNFDKAFMFVIEQEGGELENDPDDPGGLTKYGISQRAYPDMDIANITLDAAKVLYRRDYWDVCKCDSVSAGWDIMVFDTAVNCGPKTAQRLFEESDVLAEYALKRIEYYAKLKHFEKFGKGWVNRAIRCYRRCL